MVYGPDQDRIIIATTEGTFLEFDRPQSYDDDWTRFFDPIASAIAYEYEAQKNKSRRENRRDVENIWLMRVAYDLLLPMLEDEQLELLKAYCASHGRYAARGVPASVNPFQIGLMAVFARWPDRMSPQMRERLGKRLWHAARHYVPLEFVVGFIKQAEGKGLEQRVVGNEIEPGFDDWIIRQRRHRKGELDRGDYPTLTASAAAEEGDRESEDDESD